MRTNDVSSVLFGRARRLILGWLLGHPDESFYLRQIARQTGLPLGSVQWELDELLRAGLVTRTVQGRQVYFQADSRSPVFPELQSLFVKTAGIGDVLRDALRPLRDRIVVALLYGSAARNELRNDSDIDLLVVGDLSFADVVGAVSAAQRVLGREVNPTVYPPEEFAAKLRSGHHFVTAVLAAPHVLVIGEADDLERLGAAQQVARRTQADEGRDQRHVRRRRAGTPRQRSRRSES